MKKFALALAALTIFGVGGCSLFWPERFTVNAPMFHQMLGIGGGEVPPDDLLDSVFRAPDGWGVGVFAKDLATPRWMKETPTGDVLISLPRSGEVVLLFADADGDGGSDGRAKLIGDLNSPHGLEIIGEWLYIAETDAIGRVRFDPVARETRGDFERVLTGLPGGGNHWSRTIRMGSDGWIYVSIGSSCNACEESDERRAAIMRLRPDGSGAHVYARGLRNSVGFDWRPATGELFATDNGRDLLGNDFPPCELNRIVEGGFYGWPYANGAKIPDPDFGEGHADEIAATIPPAFEFRAHNAPLGMTFLRHANAGDHRGSAIVALHGSWNRTQKDGYKVVSLHWDRDGKITERDFLTGFRDGEDVIGRPVDVIERRDGSVLVSDDYAGVLYRVARGARTTVSVPGPRTHAGRDPLASVPVGDRIARAQRGEVLWSEHACAGCHVTEEAADGVVVKPLLLLGERFDVVALAAFLKTPTPPMPAFPLDGEARLDLSTYLLGEFR